MKKQETIYGHGDVRLFLLESLPEGLEAFGKNSVAEGEVTGHAHRVDSNAEVLVDPKTHTRYLHVVAPSNLTHEEHDTRTVPPGVYRIGIVRETDHIGKVTRRVAD
jgi:hypothetical protein